MIATGFNPSVPLAVGEHTLDLVVEDALNATATDSVVVHVVGDTLPPVVINLSATPYKVKGIHTVDLVWNGSSAATMDVVRDDVVVNSVTNTGAHTDSTNQKGKGNYVYRV